jgi:hypothetical protein
MLEAAVKKRLNYLKQRGSNSNGVEEGDFYSSSKIRQKMQRVGIFVASNNK